MEIAWLEDFLALSSTKVFAKAADVRNISQSAFTRRIKNLEYWVGATLFDRSVHPVALTPAGLAFLETAHETLRTLNDARREARGIARTTDEVLEFVALHSLAISFFPKWMAGLEVSFGPVKSRVQADDFSGCVEAVLSGSSDFMLGFHHPAVPSRVENDRYPSITIATDTLIAVSAADRSGQPIHRLTDDGGFAFLTHPADSFLGRTTQMLLEGAGLLGRARLRHQNSIAEALKNACLQGFGICWLPRLAVTSELEREQLTRVSDPSQETRLLIRLHRAHLTGRPEIERFWAFASATAARL